MNVLTDVCIKIVTLIHQRIRSIVRLVPALVESWSEEQYKKLTCWQEFAYYLNKEQQMKCQRSVVNRRKDVSIDPTEVNSIHECLDRIGLRIDIFLINHPVLYHIHLGHTVMLTVEDEEDQMVVPRPAPNRLRNGVRDHVNPNRR